MSDEQPRDDAAPTIRQIQRYGWLPDLPDARDQLYSTPALTLAAPPPSVDLAPGFGPVFDQGQLGSCTANALVGAYQFDVRKQQLPDLVPSRLFVYYNERVIEGTVGYDSGAQLRDGVKTLVKQGVCAESDWPYDIDRFADKPPPSCYTAALQHRAARYARVRQTTAQLKGCLAEGFPVVFGFTVYESFETEDVARTGVVPMPTAGERVLGGHAVVAVGYDESQQRFRIRNSWGTQWGQDGYCTMPYAYLTDDSLSSDFWTLRLVR